jgi:hypothetical protein
LRCFQFRRCSCQGLSSRRLGSLSAQAILHLEATVNFVHVTTLQKKGTFSMPSYAISLVISCRVAMMPLHVCCGTEVLCLGFCLSQKGSVLWPCESHYHGAPRHCDTSTVSCIHDRATSWQTSPSCTPWSLRISIKSPGTPATALGGTRANLARIYPSLPLNMPLDGCHGKLEQLITTRAVHHGPPAQILAAIAYHSSKHGGHGSDHNCPGNALRTV